MDSKWIQNFDELAVSEERRLALEIVESGYAAIDTERIVHSAVSLRNSTLRVQDKEFDLKKFKHIRIIGFGKAACKAALALEAVLGERISSGVVVSTSVAKCNSIEVFQGTHPRASAENIKATKRIFELSQGMTEDDLVLVIVSGGGSALLCWPEEECEQNQKLYDAFLDTGGTIQELNTVREHISLIKGGGLAKMLYPATVVGLIFSDVPGTNYRVIASGPTFKSATTIKDAEKIINKYKLGNYTLLETPKDDRYFEKVTNVLMVSNETALQAMKWRAGELGYNARILSSELYDTSADVMKQFQKASRPHEFVLGGGEPRLYVKGNHGSGGRNLFTTLTALDDIRPNQLFISFASDGRDNCDVAGAIADIHTLEKVRKGHFSIKKHYEHFDALTLFEKTGDTIITGPTEANVSDLMLLFENGNKD